MLGRLLKTLLGHLETLRGFFLLSTTGIALLVFLGATFASSLLYEKLINQRTLDTSRDISQQTFNAIYQILRNGGGHQQVLESIGNSASAFASAPRDVVLYPAPDVFKSEARGSLADYPEDVRQLLAGGQASVMQDGQQLRYLFPVAVRSECLVCHGVTQSDKVLGVVAIDYTLQPIAPQVRFYFISLFVVLGAVVLLVAAAVSALATRRVRLAMDTFRDKVEAVNSIKDLNQLDVSEVHLGFDDLNQTLRHVTQLVDRMKNVAVDKGILEFEVKLLEKLIITSNVVRDWRQFINDLLLEINSIVDAYALLTIFRIDDQGYEWEVFWRQKPSAATIALFEHIVRTQLESTPNFFGTTLLQIKHHVADPGRQLPELSQRDIELQTKSLLLDSPKIGGIVGIGVHSTLAQDPIRHIVISSILTALLNLVGSVKAIYKYTKELEHYATRDPLTDLYNQRMFWELLGYEIGRSQRHNYEFAVMVLDMDNFKAINDAYGHQFGDAFLQAFAKILHQAVRQGDLLARYGGDEFAIVLPEAGESQAHMVAQRIAEMLEDFSLEAPGSTVKIKATTSIGIAIHPTHGKDSRELFLIADNMMYKAKRAGKNSIAIPSDEDMVEALKQASDKSQMIRSALDEGRIVPFFQPIVHSRTGEVLIHELLMRIQIGQRIVAAQEFIEEAEAMGLAHKMDYQLIEKAFGQIREQGYRGILFVNLSPKALIVGEFISRIPRLAREYEIEPNRIVFEITERETVSNLSLLEKFVFDLKTAGFSFAIDDFGSGYSSFQYIKRFPVDYIKIEGEFIRNVLVDPEYKAFTKSIVTLAQELNIQTIAEYVEDQPILDAVLEFGIDYAQGYHIGRPGPKLRCG